jgi:hypothetical protein
MAFSVIEWESKNQTHCFSIAHDNTIDKEVKALLKTTGGKRVRNGGRDELHFEDNKDCQSAREQLARDLDNAAKSSENSSALSAFAEAVRSATIVVDPATVKIEGNKEDLNQIMEYLNTHTRAGFGGIRDLQQLDSTKVEKPDRDDAIIDALGGSAQYWVVGKKARGIVIKHMIIVCPESNIYENGSGVVGLLKSLPGHVSSRILGYGGSHLAVNVNAWDTDSEYQVEVNAHNERLKELSNLFNERGLRHKVSGNQLKFAKEENAEKQWTEITAAIRDYKKALETHPAVKVSTSIA